MRSVKVTLSVDVPECMNDVHELTSRDRDLELKVIEVATKQQIKHAARRANGMMKIQVHDMQRNEELPPPPYRTLRKA